MYYIIYKITNNVNGRIYVGCHSTCDVNDSYMGSGKIIKLAIQKYGVENFKKDVLFVFDNPSDMFDREAIIVNDSFIKNNNTYNIKLGGEGGWDHVNKIHNSEQGKRLNEFLTYEQRSSGGINSVNKTNKIVAERRKADSIYNDNYIKFRAGLFKGHKHTDETKRKISEANSKHQRKENNSQYGTMWITNGVDNKKIKKTKILPEGFRKGRVLFTKL